MDLSMRTEPITPPETDAVHGFAWWRLGPDGVLTSPGGHRWSPGANEAVCSLYPRFLGRRWRRLHPDGVPGTGCRCGFRASFWPMPGGLRGDVAPEIWSGLSRSVVAAFRGWGAILVEDGGWRSAYARPLALYAAPAAQAEQEAWARL